MPQNLFKTKFSEEYDRLNQEQKQAVDTIEGPVMVIAGAGTGKTQTIALRIGNILNKTQTPPGSILCLTFTENAAANMRQRLLSIIGQSAYSVHINTFHSFCNEIILSHPDKFLFAAEIEPLDELEKIEIITNLIEALPDGALLKPWGDHQFYQREIIGRIQQLKREDISPSSLLNLIEAQELFINASAAIFEQIRSLRASKSLESDLLDLITRLKQIPNISQPIANYVELGLKQYHQGIFDIGPAKSSAVNYKNHLLKFYDSLVKNSGKQFELHQLYAGYEQELKQRGRYDFDDMILFVLNGFRQYPDLLMEYQERFQYILIDEYQDTNSAQNQIIDLLGSYFDVPNLFVVGDDDQSIFRFQGAAIENIYDFYLKYKKNLKLIILKNNYRSHQLILDSSSGLIAHNHNRIANFIENIDKSLRSSQLHDPDPINLYPAPSVLAENYYVASTIKKLIDKGTSPGEIAVLYRNNADVSDLMEMLTKMNLNFRLETGNDILDDPYIRQLTTLLSYIDNPDDDGLLFRSLSFPFLKINSVDLFKIVRFAYRRQLSLSDLISDPEALAQIHPVLKPSTLKRLHNFNIRLAKARKWQNIYSLPKFFNKVIRRFNFLPYLISQDDLSKINCLNEFYAELKRLSQSKQYDLSAFLNRLRLLSENHISLAASQLNPDSSDSIRLLTVHKAKGLEFEHVFLIKLLDKKWGNNVITSSLNLPMGILKTEAALKTLESENEEERRLFYVALTRAKKQLYLSYPGKTQAGRELLPSLFLSEIDPKLIQKVSLDSDFIASAINSIFPKTDALPFGNGNLTLFLKKFLKTDYIFNVSHLNSYLKCPYCFYYQTILRIPAAKDKFASLGTAVHAALSYLFNKLKNSNQLISEAEFLTFFEKSLKRENLSLKNYNETLAKGREELSAYYDHYQSDFNCNCLLDYDFRADHVFLDDIPITGKIDKVEILDSSHHGLPDINVVDFKTGNPDSKSSEMKLGSDYYRQLVFYKILSDLDPHFKYNVVSGTIDFVQKSKRSNNFIRKNYQINAADESEVKALIKDVYQKILNLEFPISPECDDRSDLHRLVSKK